MGYTAATNSICILLAGRGRGGQSQKLQWITYLQSGQIRRYGQDDYAAPTQPPTESNDNTVQYCLRREHRKSNPPSSGPPACAGKETFLLQTPHKHDLEFWKRSVFTRLVTEMDNELLSAVMQLLSVWNLSCQNTSGHRPVTVPPKRKQTAHGERQKKGSARWAFGWANTALHLSLTWKRCCLRCWGTENSTYIWATPRLSLGNKLNWKLPFRLPYTETRAVSLHENTDIRRSRTSLNLSELQLSRGTQRCFIEGSWTGIRPSLGGPLGRRGAPCPKLPLSPVSGSPPSHRPHLPGAAAGTAPPDPPRCPGPAGWAPLPLTATEPEEEATKTRITIFTSWAAPRPRDGAKGSGATGSTPRGRRSAALGPGAPLHRRSPAGSPGWQRLPGPQPSGAPLRSARRWEAITAGGGKSGGGAQRPTGNVVLRGWGNAPCLLRFEGETEARRSGCVLRAFTERP